MSSSMMISCRRDCACQCQQMGCGCRERPQAYVPNRPLTDTDKKATTP